MVYLYRGQKGILFVGLPTPIFYLGGPVTVLQYGHPFLGLATL